MKLKELGRADVKWINLARLGTSGVLLRTR
jgi:hypothetical protein